MSRIDRLFSLHHDLQKGSPILNAHEWAAHFKVDTRTIRRDLAFLKRKAKEELYFDTELKGYRYRNAVNTRDGTKWRRQLTLLHRLMSEPRDSELHPTDPLPEDLKELERLGLVTNHGGRLLALARRPLALTPEELYCLYVATENLEEPIKSGAQGGVRKLLAALCGDE